jgi:hypothetical protein
MQKLNKRSVTLLAMLLAVFVLPTVVSWLLFYYHDHFQFKTTNRGTLVTPVISIADLNLGQTEKKWQIIYAPKDCGGSQYDKMTFTLHQLQQALGKDYKRVVLTLMVDQSCQLKDTHEFQVMKLASQQLSQWQKKFKRENFEITDKIFLVDPLGNLFMYYPADVDAMAILKDLKKVLEVSQIG